MRIDHSIVFKATDIKLVAELLLDVVPKWTPKTRKLKAERLLANLQSCHEGYPNDHMAIPKIRHAVYDLCNLSSENRNDKLELIVQAILRTRFQYLSEVRRSYIKVNPIAPDFKYMGTIRLDYMGNSAPFTIVHIYPDLAMYKVIPVGDPNICFLIFFEDAHEQHYASLFPQKLK